jgi:hypothetical protein
LSGSSGGNVATSQDGITWDNTKNINIPFDVRIIAYNGVDTNVAGGSKNGKIGGTNFLYWSNDGINWNPSNNVLLEDFTYVDWNGTHFVSGGDPIRGSTTNLTYSIDSKNWTASNYDANNEIVGTINGITSIPIFTETVIIEALLTVDNINVVSLLEAGTITTSGLCTADSLKVTTSLDTATANVSGLCTANSLNVTTSLDTATANISGLCTADSLNVTTSLDTATANVSGLCTADSLNVTTSLKAGTITAPLATIDTLTVSTLKVKNLSDTLIADVWRNDQFYSFTNGLVYSLISDDAVVNSVSFINIPTTIDQSYIFTFIIQPSVANSPYYIRPSTNNVSVNGVSIPLYGLQNASLAGNYTYLVQQISIIYNLYATDPQFIALTSVSSY